MVAVSVLPRLWCAFAVGLLLLPPAPVAAASNLAVQQIGAVSGEIAPAIGSEVTMVPFSPQRDARTAPIILAPGKLFVRRDGEQVAGLRLAGQQRAPAGV